jgi:hypothetical protein
MNLAEGGEHRLRTLPHDAGAARMIVARRIHRDLERGHRHAKRGEHGNGIALGIHRIDAARGFRPNAAASRHAARPQRQRVVPPA